MSPDLLYSIYEAYMEGSSVGVALLICGSLAAADLALLKGRTIYQKVGLLVGSLGVAAAVFGWSLDIGPLLVFGSLLAVFTLIAACCIYLYEYRKIKEIEKLSEPFAPECDFLQAYRLLDDGIHQQLLTKRQFARYLICKISVLVQLGALKQATIILEGALGKRINPFHWHLLKANILFRVGELDECFAEYELADAERAVHESVLHECQVINARGVAYVTKGCFAAADDMFMRARSLCREKHITNRDALNAVYGNSMFNAFRVADGEVAERKAWGILEEYKSLIDLDDICDYVAYSNMILALLRQSDSSASKFQAYLDDVMFVVGSSDLDQVGKLLFASSGAKVAWAGRVNPRACLKMLQDNHVAIGQLKPMDRYGLYRDLALLADELEGPVFKSYSSLLDEAVAYMRHRALQELSDYRATLPLQAIYAFLGCTKEEAMLQKWLESHNENPAPGRLEELLNNAVGIAEENLLTIESTIARLDRLEEFLVHHSARCDLADFAAKELKLVEGIVLRLGEHPGRTELRLRLCAVKLFMRDYSGALDCYCVLGRGDMGLQHFSPTLRAQRAQQAFVLRIACFDMAVRSLRQSAESELLAPVALVWLNAYPNADEVFTCLLLSKYMGLGSPAHIIGVLFPNEGAPDELYHAWLRVDSLDVDCDVTYSRLSCDPQAGALAFIRGRHPMETHSSVALNIAEKSKGKSVLHEMVVAVGNDEERAQLFNELAVSIEKFTPRGCPSVDEVSSLCMRYLGPIPIPRKEVR